MGDNFAETAKAMMTAAETLHREGAHRNACYLAGYVVECTLKALLERGGKRKPVHDLVSLRVMVNRLLVEGDVIMARYGDPAKLAPKMSREVSPPRRNPQSGELKHFCHWNPDHRYDGTRWDAAVARDYLHEAKQCHDVLYIMLMDGTVV